MNTANEKLELREQLQVGMDENHTTLMGDPPRLDSVHLPDELNSFSYNVDAMHNDKLTYATDAAATKIEMDFNDYQRSLVVEGSSPDEVDATFAALRDDANRFSVFIGGRLYRGFILLGMSSIIVGIIFAMVNTWVQKKRRIYWPILIPIVCLGALVVMPWTDIFAGFLAVRGDASLLVRYEPQLTFVGVIIALIAMVVPLMSRRP